MPHKPTHVERIADDTRALEKTRDEVRNSDEDPLENMPLEMADEDVEIENRKPDLGELEEDTSEL
jgi:hypothetical protein